MKTNNVTDIVSSQTSVGHNDGLGVLDSLLQPKGEVGIDSNNKEAVIDNNTSNNVSTDDSNSGLKEEPVASELVTFVKDGQEYALRPEQIVASVGKSRFYDKAKREQREVLNKLEKYEEVGLNEEVLYAIRDFKNGKTEAKDYIMKALSLVDNVDEEGNPVASAEKEPYKPTIEAPRQETFSEYVHSLGDEVVNVLSNEDDFVAQGISEDILNLQDVDNMQLMKSFADDIASGGYQEVRALTEHLMISESLSGLQAFLKASEIIDNADKGAEEPQPIKESAPIVAPKDANFIEAFGDIPLTELFK